MDLREKKVKLTLDGNAVAEIPFPVIDSVVYRWKQGYYDKVENAMAVIQQELGLTTPIEQYHMFQFAHGVDQIRKAHTEEMKQNLDAVVEMRETGKVVPPSKKEEQPVVWQDDSSRKNEPFYVHDKAEACLLLKIAHMVSAVMCGENLEWCAYVMHKAGIADEQIDQAIKTLKDNARD